MRQRWLRASGRFGKDSAFLDVDNIPVGANFRKHIESAVGQCHAMLVLIGEKWLAQTEGNRNRLFEPRDYDFILTYVGSAIPEKKLRNALDSYAHGARASDVLLLYDNTFFGGARDGFLVTKTAIYWRNPGEPADSIEFRDLKSVKRSYDRGPIKLNDRAIHIAALDCAAALVRLLKGTIET